MPYDQKKIVEAIRAFERGEIVVVTDDSRRGDGRPDRRGVHVHAREDGLHRPASYLRLDHAPMPRDGRVGPISLAPMVADNDRPTRPPSP